jgi:RNA polymerase sigma factor (sigma-70 family)
MQRQVGNDVWIFGTTNERSTESDALRQTESKDIFGAMTKALTEMMRNELTRTQAEYLTDYFADGMTVKMIAQKYGVNQSTVSRTIQRGKKNLERYVDYMQAAFRAGLDNGG